MAARASLYAIRIKGRLGATALSAFPSMASEMTMQIEGLGLELLEVRQVRTQSRESGHER